MDEVKTSKKIDWNDPSVIRYHSLNMKPKTIAQARRNMVKYLKNQGTTRSVSSREMSEMEVKSKSLMKKKILLKRFVDEKSVTAREKEEVLLKKPGTKRKEVHSSKEHKEKTKDGGRFKKEKLEKEFFRTSYQEKGERKCQRIIKSLLEMLRGDFDRH
ncbi:hypothetical protein Tco_1093808 [Tanacetum coccineum]|uniref:Uncharacterized protein n=1 Tax=Tanacetum coccineum TaxID=301880 RepID=A0ABQ5IEA0_9ASTR